MRDVFRTENIQGKTVLEGTVGLRISTKGMAS
jgi:hypothetical protein